VWVGVGFLLLLTGLIFYLRKPLDVDIGKIDKIVKMNQKYIVYRCKDNKKVIYLHYYKRGNKGNEKKKSGKMG